MVTKNTSNSSRTSAHSDASLKIPNKSKSIKNNGFDLIEYLRQESTTAQIGLACFTK